MTVVERIRRCRLIEKMGQDEEFAERLGLSNSSSFRSETETYHDWNMKGEVEK